VVPARKSEPKLDPPTARASAPREPDDRKREPDDQQREQELIALLGRHRGNISEIARTMGRSRIQIHRWMQRYGLSADAFRR
jgi:transcriptional regulator of acetoin/glycerol metabolism